jgi:tripartite-type tricarboxylate transporter receptor subunit TctC
MKPGLRAARAALLASLALTPLAAIALTLALGTPVQAQTFPARPVTFIVPWPAGGTTDVALRALATATEKHLGQPFVIENRSGAAGTLGPAYMAANAKPDGYTIAQFPISIFRLPFIAKTSFDPAKDFTYIINVTGYTFGVVVRADAPWKTFDELLAYAKANPGKLTYGTPGAGTSLHITMEQIARQRGIKWVHVPYRGNAESNTALLGGHIDVVTDSTGWGQLVNEGKFRLLVTWGASRMADRADAACSRHRHRLELALRHRRPEGHGPARGQGAARRLPEGPR